MPSRGVTTRRGRERCGEREKRKSTRVCSFILLLLARAPLCAPDPTVRHKATVSRPADPVHRTREGHTPYEHEHAQALSFPFAMRPTLAALAQIGRLATPPPSAAASTLPPELKVRDFFREVRVIDKDKARMKRREKRFEARRQAVGGGRNGCAFPPPPLTLLSSHHQVCRFVPWAVKNYRLDELTTPAELRSHIAAAFRARGPGLAGADPRVIDLLIYKGREELESVVLQHKQRHHLIGDYITGPRAVRDAAASQGGGAGAGESAFLRSFYANMA